jgi:hypothetical protein
MNLIDCQQKSTGKVLFLIWERCRKWRACFEGSVTTDSPMETMGSLHKLSSKPSLLRHSKNIAQSPGENLSGAMGVDGWIA